MLAPRPWPQPTLDALRPPKADFAYFAGADRVPFEPEAIGFSTANAWWLADASMLAYGDRTFVDDALARSPLPALGFSAEWAGGQNDRHVLVLHGPRVTIVAPRGTRLFVHDVFSRARLIVPSLQDLFTDAQVRLVPFGAGRVHAGFCHAFEDVRDSLQLAFDRAWDAGRKIWLTGHSLGAAVSTVAFVHVGRERIAGLYTFGCPPVGDGDFARSLAQWPIVRFVHRADWAGREPPKALPYVHAGVRHDVPSNPVEPAEESARAAVRRGFASLRSIAENGLLDMGKLALPARALADHAPVCYATGLWNALPGVGR
jgi:hypothetical protein